MENRKTFTFNGISSADYELYISGDTVYNAPARVYEMVDIPGRSGQLAIYQGRFENISVTYPAFIYADTQTEFAEKMRDLRAWLASPAGYQRLEDTYHPDEYRMAIYQEGLDADPAHYNEAGEFDLVFNCKPQRFLKSGETEITLTNPQTLTNPTPFDALPLITVTGAGSLIINGEEIVIAENSTKYIDSEIMDCYAIVDGEAVSKNDKITLSEFPKLGASTSISWEGLTSVKIKPRWWTI